MTVLSTFICLAGLVRPFQAARPAGEEITKEMEEEFGAPFMQSFITSPDGNLFSDHHSRLSKFQPPPKFKIQTPAFTELSAKQMSHTSQQNKFIQMLQPNSEQPGNNGPALKNTHLATQQQLTENASICVEVYPEFVAACTMPDLSNSAPDQIIGVPTVNTSRALDGTFPLNWAARFQGILKITFGGDYIFSLEVGQADFAQVYVNNIPLVRSACFAGQEPASNSTPLSTGSHRVEVLYADDGYHDHLRLFYQGVDTWDSISGQNRRIIIPPTAWDKQNCEEVTTPTRTTTTMGYPDGPEPVCASVYLGCVNGCEVPDLDQFEISFNTKFEEVYLPLDQHSSPDEMFGYPVGPNFAVRFFGKFEIIIPGKYTFQSRIGLPDSMLLKIDGYQVLKTECPYRIDPHHSETERTIGLPPGEHTFEVIYGNDGTMDAIGLWFKGADTSGVFVLMPGPNPLSDPICLPPTSTPTTTSTTSTGPPTPPPPTPTPTPPPSTTTTGSTTSGTTTTSGSTTTGTTGPPTPPPPTPTPTPPPSSTTTGSTTSGPSTTTVSTTSTTTTPAVGCRVCLDTYTGDFLCVVPDFSNLTHEFGTCVPNVNFSGGPARMPIIYGWQTPRFWAARWRGTLIVSTGGTYTFDLSAGIMDSAAIWINGQRIGNFDCEGGEVTIDLPPGLITIIIDYSDYGWTDEMILWWSGPDSGFVRVIIPEERFQIGGGGLCTQAPDKCSSFDCNGAPSATPDKLCPATGCTESFCCPAGTMYDKLGDTSGCGTMDGGTPQFHERCVCNREAQEADVLKFCKDTCDNDDNCKAYVERIAFGLQTCQIATTSDCPSRCSKFDQGTTGPIVEIQRTNDKYHGCHVKHGSGLLQLTDADSGMGDIRPHGDMADIRPHGSAVLAQVEEPCDATSEKCIRRVA